MSGQTLIAKAAEARHCACLQPEASTWWYTQSRECRSYRTLADRTENNRASVRMNSGERRACSKAVPPMSAYEATPAGTAFVASLATVLTHLVSLNSQDRAPITHFHAVTAPDISIRDYLGRIQKYFGCSDECFVLSLVYIDRVVKLHQKFTVSILNVHRLLITSIMLAAKFFDDVYYSNAFYARVGGVRTREINLLEWQFLAFINYHLYVPPREYDQYRRNVMTAVNAGIKRPLPPAATITSPESHRSVLSRRTSVGTSHCGTDNGDNNSEGHNCDSQLASPRDSSSDTIQKAACSTPGDLGYYPETGTPPPPSLYRDDDSHRKVDPFSGIVTPSTTSSQGGSHRPSGSCLEEDYEKAILTDCAVSGGSSSIKFPIHLQQRDFSANGSAGVIVRGYTQVYQGANTHSDNSSMHRIRKYATIAAPVGCGKMKDCSNALL